MKIELRTETWTGNIKTKSFDNFAEFCDALIAAENSSTKLPLGAILHLPDGRRKLWKHQYNNVK